MRLFVSEFLTSGAWPDFSSVTSLLSEGRSMALALLRDCAALPGCRVHTTWDSRLPLPDIDGVEVAVADSRRQERDLYQRLSAACDGTLVIAPESDGVLTAQAGLAIQVGGNWLGCSVEAIDLCGDKFALARHLRSHDIPTIETGMIPADAQSLPFPFPVVVKPVDGAGAEAVQRLDAAIDLKTYWNRMLGDTPRADTPPPGDAVLGAAPGWIVQPFVPGTAVSMAAIIEGNSVTGMIETTVLAEQRFAHGESGDFQYLGGRLPVVSDADGPARELVIRACRTIPGLSGYVGFDMILIDGDPQRPVIVEINPRLTTSYPGYSRLYGRAFAARMLAASGFRIDSNRPAWDQTPSAEILKPDPQWADSIINYTAAGEIFCERRRGD